MATEKLFSDKQSAALVSKARTLLNQQPKLTVFGACLLALDSLGYTTKQFKSFNQLRAKLVADFRKQPDFTDYANDTARTDAVPYAKLQHKPLIAKLRALGKVVDPVAEQVATPAPASTYAQAFAAPVQRVVANQPNTELLNSVYPPDFLWRAQAEKLDALLATQPDMRWALLTLPLPPVAPDALSATVKQLTSVFNRIASRNPWNAYGYIRAIQLKPVSGTTVAAQLKVLAAFNRNHATNKSGLDKAVLRNRWKAANKLDHTPLVEWEWLSEPQDEKHLAAAESFLTFSDYMRAYEDEAMRKVTRVRFSAGGFLHDLFPSGKHKQVNTVEAEPAEATPEDEDDDKVYGRTRTTQRLHAHSEKVLDRILLGLDFEDVEWYVLNINGYECAESAVVRATTTFVKVLDWFLLQVYKVESSFRICFAQRERANIVIPRALVLLAVKKGSIKNQQAFALNADSKFASELAIAIRRDVPSKLRFPARIPQSLVGVAELIPSINDKEQVRTSVSQGMSTICDHYDEFVWSGYDELVDDYKILNVAGIVRNQIYHEQLQEAGLLGAMKANAEQLREVKAEIEAEVEALKAQAAQGEPEEQEHAPGEQAELALEVPAVEPVAEPLPEPVAQPEPVRAQPIPDPVVEEPTPGLVNEKELVKLANELVEQTLNRVLAVVFSESEVNNRITQRVQSYIEARRLQIQTTVDEAVDQIMRNLADKYDTVETEVLSKLLILENELKEAANAIPEAALSEAKKIVGTLAQAAAKVESEKAAELTALATATNKLQVLVVGHFSSSWADIVRLNPHLDLTMTDSKLPTLTRFDAIYVTKTMLSAGMRHDLKSAKCAYTPINGSKSELLALLKDLA